MPDLDSFFVLLSDKELDVYHALAEYHVDLKQRNISNSTIICRVTTAKNFLEYNDVSVSGTKFKLKVSLPKQSHGDIEALNKEIIRKILIACNNDKRLQTYILCLASTGMRASEALSVRLMDIDFKSSKIRLRAQFTKTKRPRFVYMTKECLEHMKNWKEYRERARRVVGRDGIPKIVEKPFAQDDLFFSTGRRELSSSPYLYHTVHECFAQLLDSNGFKTRTEDGKRRQFTLHSFRRFVKSTISDLGYQDYSEWFIGHAGSTYYRKTEAEKLDIFKKIEPYLTFLDYSTLEAQGQDTQTQLEQKDTRINQLENQYNELNTKFDRLATMWAQVLAVESKASNKDEFVKSHKQDMYKLVNKDIKIPKFEELKD